MDQSTHIERVAFWFATEYAQFSIEDINFDIRTAKDEIDVSSAEVQKNRIAVQPGRITIITETDNPLLVTCSVHATLPDIEPQRYAHIVEGSLTITGNQLLLMPCPDPAPIGSIFLPADTYRIRIAIIAIATKAPGYPYIDHETFEIMLWPAPTAAVQRIKGRR